MTKLDEFIDIGLEAFRATRGTPDNAAVRINEEAINQFLQYNWYDLAATAYAGYNKVGRGVVLVYPNGDLPREADWKQLFCAYIPLPLLDDLRKTERFCSHRMAKQAIKFAETYDPTIDAVVCVANPAFRQWLAVVAHAAHVTAKQAYERMPEHFFVTMG